MFVFSQTVSMKEGVTFFLLIALQLRDTRVTTLLQHISNPYTCQTLLSSPSLITQFPITTLVFMIYFISGGKLNPTAILIKYLQPLI